MLLFSEDKTEERLSVSPRATGVVDDSRTGALTLFSVAVWALDSHAAGVA